MLLMQKKNSIKNCGNRKNFLMSYFFNGGTSIIYNKEDRIIIPSPKVTTYDQKPEMSALEITTILLDRIQRQTYDFIVANFANADMVGHTGNLEAGIKAVKVVDFCIKEGSK